jgi:hypothetical protein
MIVRKRIQSLQSLQPTCSSAARSTGEKRVRSNVGDDHTESSQRTPAGGVCVLTTRRMVASSALTGARAAGDAIASPALNRPVEVIRGSEFRACTYFIQ